MEGPECHEIFDPDHMKSVDWEEQPSTKVDEMGNTIPVTVGPPMPSTITRRRKAFEEKMKKHRDASQVSTVFDGIEASGQCRETGTSIVGIDDEMEEGEE